MGNLNLVGSRSCQSLAVTQDSVKSLLLDPEVRDFPVNEELERLTHLGEAMRGSQFSSVLLVHNSEKVLVAGEVKGRSSSSGWFCCI